MWRRAGVLWLGACALVQAPAAAGCAEPWWSGDVGVQRSRWEEVDVGGRSLVREQGRLRVLAASLGGRCGGMPVKVRLRYATGSRAYDGVSTTQAPLKTTSRVRSSELLLEGLEPVTDQASIGAQIRHQSIERDIASAGAVLGYPERFSHSDLAVGGRYERVVADRWRAGIDAWFGAGPRGRLKLQLPHADVARLTLGRSGRAQLGAWLDLQPASPESRGIQLTLKLDYSHQRLRQGPAQAITRNGIPIGGAAQPAVRQSDLAAGVAARCAF